MGHCMAKPYANSDVLLFAVACERGMLCGWPLHAHHAGVFGDPKARVITLVRLSKKRCAGRAAGHTPAGTTGRCAGYATCPMPTRAFTWTSRCGAFSAGAAAR